MAIWTLACGFSVTAGYHRLFAHGTYRAHGLVRAFYLVFGAAAVENSALKWCSDHRRHHSYVDEADDPYNIRRGFWWAHMGWIFFKDPPQAPGGDVRDLERDALVRWQHRFYVPLAVLAGFAMPMAVGWALGDAWGGLVLAGFARLIVLYHATFCVNSLAHYIGSQPYSDRNSSRDSFVTALITLGEGYHNFHHTFPYDYRNGIRGYQVDPTKWLIHALSATGLATDLVRAPQDTILKARLRMDERRAATWSNAHPHAAEQLRALRERLEVLAEQWSHLLAQFRELRARTEGRSRDAIVALRRQIREARHRFREEYRAWLQAIRGPEYLAAGA
jgi:stearoyl-CoA desaturase (delta-9 desaturase)